MKTLEELGISPAPWVQKVWATSDDYGHDISDYNHRSICDMRLLQGDTRIPNAHLIAAAPELYDALFEMVEMYRDGGSYDYEQDVIKKAKAALANAAGESEVKK